MVFKEYSPNYSCVEFVKCIKKKRKTSLCLFSVSNCTKVCVIYKTVRLARYLGSTPTPARINSAGIRKAFNFFFIPSAENLTVTISELWFSGGVCWAYSAQRQPLLGHYTFLHYIFLHLEEQNCEEDLVEKNTQEASSLPSPLNHSVLRLLATTYHNNLWTVTH